MVGKIVPQVNTLVSETLCQDPHGISSVSYIGKISEFSFWGIRPPLEDIVVNNYGIILTK